MNELTEEQIKVITKEIEKSLTVDQKMIPVRQVLRDAIMDEAKAWFMLSDARKNNESANNIREASYVWLSKIAALRTCEQFYENELKRFELPSSQ